MEWISSHRSGPRQQQQKWTEMEESVNGEKSILTPLKQGVLTMWTKFTEVTKLMRS